MDKTTGIVLGVLAVVVIAGGVYFMTRNVATNPSDNLKTAEQNQDTTYTGRVVFSVTDAAADMSTISEINMKVNSVEVHSTASGWVTASTTPRVYNLLALNASKKSELLADVDLETGTYDQVRLMVDSIAIKMKTGVIKEAKLPSSELRINAKLLVNRDMTSSVNFDFLADKSLHTTGNGSYIFAPVVKIETKSNADVSVDNKSVVTITGGRIDDANTVGMDIDGSVKINFQINSKQKLNIDSNNVIKIEGVLLK